MPLHTCSRSKRREKGAGCEVSSPLSVACCVRAQVEKVKCAHTHTVMMLASALRTPCDVAVDMETASVWWFLEVNCIVCVYTPLPPPPPNNPNPFFCCLSCLLQNNEFFLLHKFILIAFQAPIRTRTYTLNMKIFLDTTFVPVPFFHCFNSSCSLCP